VEEFYKKAENIKLAIFDVDGVMTDGSLLLGQDGNEYKIFNVRDGLGLVMLKESGIKTAVVTGRESKVVAERMAQLNVDYICQGVKDKKACLEELVLKSEITTNQISFTGDDLIDIPAFQIAGLSIAVADADERVIAAADWVTSRAGGKGAVREVCEAILNAKGLLESFLQRRYGM
jgi:3-deoxy-D-manno-octulosonate 8-phosphate phosphatase (KDO 8-P phosphatase)